MTTPKPRSLKLTEVSASDDTARRLLPHLHGACFDADVALTRPEEEFWWIAWDDVEPVGFAGLAAEADDTGYLCRSGVLPKARGRGLQARLIRAREAKARDLGLVRMTSDTTRNVPSANNLIRAGYRLFEPAEPWAFPETLYWEKAL